MVSLMVVCLILILHPQSGIYANTEGDALYAFKETLIDPQEDTDGWSSYLPNPCTWFYVKCNNDNSVINVDLGNAGFSSGHLVAELGNLTSLEHLEFYHNNLDGSIPNELGNLTNLMSLDLYNNRLTGSIPNSLGNLQDLLYFRLHDNKLTGYIPKTLTRLRKLLVLDLSNNQLSGKLPKALAKLPKLRSLNLSHNNLSGQVPKAFMNIQFVDLTNNAHLRGPCTKNPCQYY